MIKPSINLQELRRRIYRKAKAERQWRFWGLYVHVCKMETLRAAYQQAETNDGTPGSMARVFRPSKPKGWRSFWRVLARNFSNVATNRPATGEWRSRKGTAKRAAWEFQRSRIEWSKER